MSSSRFEFPLERDLPDTPFRQVVDALLNLVYPQSCVSCDHPLSRASEKGVCGSCWRKVQQLRLTSPLCPLCGLPQIAESTETLLCVPCILHPPPFGGARSFGYYTGELSRLIQAFKFEGTKNLVALLAALLAETFTEHWDRSEIDMVVPVPLHPKRVRERTFNQAALLAHKTAGMLGLRAELQLLKRVVHTAPQVGLTDKQRLRNVQHVFRCDPRTDLQQKQILLIDDVMTTGATLSSCARLLQKTGAVRVFCLTLARTVPGAMS